MKEREEKRGVSPHSGKAAENSRGGRDNAKRKEGADDRCAEEDSKQQQRAKSSAVSCGGREGEDGRLVVGSGSVVDVGSGCWCW